MVRFTGANNGRAHLTALRAGILVAFPHVRLDGKLIMKVEGWDNVDRRVKTLDDFDMSIFGNWGSVHDVPMRMLSAPFRVQLESELPELGWYGHGVKFTRGGMFRLQGDWNFPFFGDRIGTYVKRFEPPSELTRGVN